ncbi:hypothetical protein BC936DRAFT_142945 [Jimgerdemannia flammicorona]|uniref:Uncharacterized protein n=1 Tax=Jimgerdemannia flammicorona TaxID=994334 RepID=A0A432ZZN8_9FUNG|nr:hypothetical protein BC936DRAFT_142945 [Jimgerdemannia flammicorona]
MELSEQIGADGKEIAPSELLDLAHGAEGRTHDDGIVTVLLVVVVDLGDGMDTGVLVLIVVLAGGLLVPVKVTADVGRDQGDTSLSASDGLKNPRVIFLQQPNPKLHTNGVYLREREQQRQVAVNVVLGLKNVRSLDTLPGRGDLDRDATLVNAGLLVELDDTECLGNGALGIEGEAGINLGGDATGNDLEDLNTKVYQESIQGPFNLGVGVAEQDK